MKSDTSVNPISFTTNAVNSETLDISHNSWTYWNVHCAMCMKVLLLVMATPLIVRK